MAAVLVVETDKVQSVIGDFYLSALLKGNLSSLLRRDEECDPVVYGARLTASGAMFL